MAYEEGVRAYTPFVGDVGSVCSKWVCGTRTHGAERTEDECAHRSANVYCGVPGDFRGCRAIRESVLDATVLNFFIFHDVIGFSGSGAFLANRVSIHCFIACSLEFFK